MYVFFFCFFILMFLVFCVFLCMSLLLFVLERMLLRPKPMIHGIPAKPSAQPLSSITKPPTDGSTANKCSANGVAILHSSAKKGSEPNSKGIGSLGYP